MALPVHSASSESSRLPGTGCPGGPQGCLAALHGRDVEVVVPWLEAAVLRTGILNMAPMIAAIAMMNDSCVRQEMIDELKLTHLRQIRFTTSTCLVK